MWGPGRTFTARSSGFAPSRATYHCEPCTPASTPTSTSAAPLHTGRSAIHRRKAQDWSLFQHCRPNDVVQALSQFAATLRKHDAGGVQAIGVLGLGGQKSVKIPFLGKLLAAGSANGKMLLDERRFLLIGFAANVENQQRRNLLANVARFQRLHRSSPN